MNINVPEDKEEQIYIAAINEFTKEGYKNASTNNIVKISGISKGALFKYFGNKRKLYIYVVIKSLDIVEKELLRKMVNLSSDMFERIIQVQKIKLELTLRFMQESSIITQFFVNEEQGFEAELKDKYTYYEQLSMELLTKDIDYSKFKDGVDIKKVFGTLLVISYGYKDIIGRKYGGDIKLMVENIDEITRELNEHLSLVKDSVYK